MPANPLPGRALLSYALHYAALGWPVLPLHTIRPDGRCSCGEVSCRTPGKHPRTARGQDEASSDPEVIRRWWQRWPAANIGVRADLAGLAVIDIDPRNGGSVEALPEPLDTLAARTGGGGWHLFVKAPELAAFPSKLATGIDIKHHGYVVVEPSMHASGERYAFIDWEVGDPLPRVADAPLWLLRPQGMDAAPPEPDAGILEALTAEQLADLEATLRTIPSDDRGTWVAVGHALRTVADHGFRLWDAWSQGSAKYDAADARRVWESFKPRTTHWKWVLKHAEELGGRNVHQATTPTVAGGRAGHVTSSVDGWAFADFATLESDPPPARRWIVRDWIPACSVTALFGSGGIGRERGGLHVRRADRDDLAGADRAADDVKLPGEHVRLTGRALLHRVGMHESLTSVIDCRRRPTRPSAFGPSASPAARPGALASAGHRHRAAARRTRPRGRTRAA